MTDLTDHQLGWLADATGHDVETVADLVSDLTAAGIVVDFTFPEPDPSQMTAAELVAGGFASPVAAVGDRLVGPGPRVWADGAIS